MILLDALFKNLSAKQRRMKQRLLFAKARLAEREYQHALASIGRSVGNIIRGFAYQSIEDLNMPGLNDALVRYADLLQPWAVAVTARMQSEVKKRDTSAWIQVGKAIGKNLREEIEGASTGTPLRLLMNEHVKSITSIPLEAGARVRRLSEEMLIDSSRSNELYKDIMRSGIVAANKAKMISRTAVATTASVLTQVRAEHIGSEGYIWRTSGDPDVRPYHKKLEGKFIRWDDPPIVEENGYRAHAGANIANCRCYPEVIVPDIM